MRDYASLRKKNSGNLAILIALGICVLLSATLLFSRLLTYSTTEPVQQIPLTKSNGVTRVTASQAPSAAVPMPPKMLVAMPLLNSKAAFEARDENVVWSGETDIEIFSIRYENKSGEVTVRSQDGAKVLAPGVGGSYSFELANTGKVSLDFTMEMDAWYSDTQYQIPVVVRVTDSADQYLLGSAEEAAEVLKLKEVQDSGTIAAGYVKRYTLEWEWPFEDNDAYDTMLGNAAMDEDIVLTVQIRTTAEGSSDPDAPGGDVPKTGDDARVGVYALLMVISLAGILVVLLLYRKEEGNEAS